MKKKLLVILISCIFCFSLGGCSQYNSYDNTKPGGFIDDDWGAGYFTIVESWGGTGVHQCMIVYANDTKVMYFVDAYSIAGGITPLYNADGTIRIYNEEHVK